MSRRTFIKQWNPAVPIGGRGRGRRKKGSDPDQVFSTAYRTVHDPADERRPAGRDADGSTRFYSASGLTTTGIPVQDDRFRAHTLSTRGGRGGIQQRVGMFRNAIQSNVIFGGPSERVIRHSKRKIDRLIAPESDVPESVVEWRRSPQRNTQRRRDVYEYDSEDEDEGLEEPPRYQPRRRVSNSRRAPEPRRDPDYDPYEFRDDETEDEAFVYQPPPRPRRSNSRLTVGGPSRSREPSAYARERLRGKDERRRPRRLFDGATDEEEEEVARRSQRRVEERHEVPRMEKRNSKRAREVSPAHHPLAAVRHPVARRHSHQRRDAVAAAPAEATPVVGFGGHEKIPFGNNGKQSRLKYTPSLAKSIASRILSGLPPIRLKEGDGSETYLAASLSIISSALERFTDKQDGGEAVVLEDDEDDDGNPDEKNPEEDVMRALFERTQLINVSEESEDDDEEDSSGKEGAIGASENIFSRHTSEASPVLERLFDQTMREAVLSRNGMNGVREEEEEEVDTAKMLGLGEVMEPQEQPGFEEIGEEPFTIVPLTAGESATSASNIDPFAIAPRTAGESTSSGSSSAISLFSNRGHRNVSMAEAANRSLALMGPPTREQPMMHRGNAGSGASSRSTDYSSDRSSESARANAAVERSFHFQMSATNRSAVAPNNYMHNHTAPPNHFMHNNNDGSFNFEF